MEANVKKVIRNFLKHFDIAITRQSTIEKALEELISSAAHDIEVLEHLDGVDAKLVLKYFHQSKSQLRQDLFVLSRLNFKKHGYFVEFGATNGYHQSNTYLMEKEFSWNGILAEPATIWHKDLKGNRSCNIDTGCVWKDSSSTLAFNQVAAAQLSTIDRFSDADGHKEARKEGKIYNVSSISLNDLLLKYDAPRDIDYLSIDTEGSEYEILSNFDFSKHSFSVITCEHNYTPMRDNLYALLKEQGYQRVFEKISLFDDWYVNPNACQR